MTVNASHTQPTRRFTTTYIATGIVVFFLIAGPASAETLIGDSININGRFPTVNEIFSRGSTIVDDSATDTVLFGAPTNNVFAHANGLQLIIGATGPAIFDTAPPATDGGNIISFEDLDFDDGSVIAGVSISQTFGQIIASDLIVGDDFVRVNVSGIRVQEGDRLVIDLRTSSMPPLELPTVASLVDDRIEIVGLFPTLNDVFNSDTVIVDTTDTDRVNFGGGSFAQADDLQLIFSVPNATRFATAPEGEDAGNFIVFQDLTFGDGSVITGVSLSSTFGGIGVDDLVFGDDFVRFNVNGIAPNAGDQIVIDLTTSSTVSPVPLVSSVLPTSRSVSVGDTATAFATIVNPSPNTARDCSISMSGDLTNADFFFQATDPLSNAPIGEANSPATIPAGGLQSFVFGITPQVDFDPTEVELGFGCRNSTAASSFVGLNTLLLSATQGAVADVIALAATIANDGIVRVDPVTNAGAFSVASINVGSGDSLQVTADTGLAVLPVELSVCQTDTNTGQCMNPTVPTTEPISVEIGANETPTFAVFAASTEAIPLDPANSRVFIRFQDTNGLTRGATSVAVTAE